MGEQRDRELGMFRRIARRDFLNGVAVGVGAAAAHEFFPTLAWADGNGAVSQDDPGYYPPAQTGLRGSHVGSFEDAHKLKNGNFWKSVGQPPDTAEEYDLIVVGGGISGLAAAHFWRAKKPDARILVLDNHDDFGGHAKRNEFRPGGRLLLANGGTWAIESPFPYSEVAHGLLDELGIHPEELAEKCYVRDTYKGLGNALFFDKETFGAEKLVTGAPGEFGDRSQEKLEKFASSIPLPEEARRDLFRIETCNQDFYPGLSSDEKKDRLSRISYQKYLLDVAKVDPRIVPIYQKRTHGLYGVGIDAVSALDCWVIQLPGYGGLKLDPGPHPRMGYTARGYATPKPPYDFHFPDGNASIARMLVRKLIPKSAPGNTAEDIVTAKMDYSQLDKRDSSVRIRLSSIVVSAHHESPQKNDGSVVVSYLRGGKLFSTRGKHVVMACWNMMIPYLCPELPEKQKEAMHYGVKIPLVYTAVAIRNWRSFEKLGLRRISTPGMYHHDVSLDLAVNIGDYRSPRTPEEPILVRMERMPCFPGLPERDQHRAGRGDLLATSFETFERNIRDQLGRVLGPGGFDPARDIDAITVNRWPHGYAYEYNFLFDPQWLPGQSPCEIARKPFGRIAIANADAAAAAYTDVAINEGHRAVQDLLSI